MNKYKFRQILFGVLCVLWLAGGFYFLIQKDYMSAIMADVYSWLSGGLFVTWALFWIVSFVAGFPSFIRKWMNGE
jgi:hypothetical protein